MDVNMDDDKREAVRKIVSTALDAGKSMLLTIRSGSVSEVRRPIIVGETHLQFRAMDEHSNINIVAYEDILRLESVVKNRP